MNAIDRGWYETHRKKGRKEKQRTKRKTFKIKKIRLEIEANKLTTHFLKIEDSKISKIQKYQRKRKREKKEKKRVGMLNSVRRNQFPPEGYGGIPRTQTNHAIE